MGADYIGLMEYGLFKPGNGSSLAAVGKLPLKNENNKDWLLLQGVVYITHEMFSLEVLNKC